MYDMNDKIIPHFHAIFNVYNTLSVPYAILISQNGVRFISRYSHLKQAHPYDLNVVFSVNEYLINKAIYKLAVKGFN